jgi:hypothetical protein
MKRSILIVAGVAAAFALAGCASAPVALAPVGPNPIGYQSQAGDGQLEVFSALSGHGEGNNPTWYRHTDYYICNQQGERLQHVENSVGHYSQAPRVVLLPPGEYIVEARAKGTLRVRVPVIIKFGERTSVHLDGAWQPSEGGTAQIVYAPTGYPVGWCTDTQ